MKDESKAKRLRVQSSPRAAWPFFILRPLSFILFLLLVSAASAEQPADWPQWRGPNRDAICRETGLLQSWPEDGPPLLWKVTGLGGGYSTPAIHRGRICGLSYRGSDEVVWCLDAATRRELWVRRIAAKGRVGYNEGSRGTPTLDAGRLYVVGVSGDVACLDVADGRILWSRNFERDFGGRMMSGWGFSESPLIDGEKVIVTPGGDAAALVALDKTTGRTLWQAAVPDGGGAGYGSPMLAEVGGVRMAINWLGRALVGVAVDDGRLLWQYARTANQTANIPTVIVRGDTVFCSTAYNTGSAVLRLERTADGVRAVEVAFVPPRVFQNHHGGVVLVGEHIYGGHGTNGGAPTCLEFTTGKLAWKQDRSAGGGSAAVLYADGHLIFRWQDGTLGLIEANPERYKLKGSFRPKDRPNANAWAHPVIVDGRLYLRDQDLLLCYDLRDSRR
jgi:outer membrane protein assembly factor BamB